MFAIKTYNKISDKGLSLLTNSNYRVSDTIDSPDAIILRSQDLHDMPVDEKLKAIARAGAGVNNIPVAKLTSLGIPVFNTPGANANAVKELVLGALFISSRHLCDGWQHTHSLQGDTVAKEVEVIKKSYAGFELQGKVLGIIGLGAIGVLVANAALALGMQVIGFDPHITINNAWQLSSNVIQATSANDVLRQADMLTVHVPYHSDTHHLIDQSGLAQMKPTAALLNFSRADVVNTDAVITALESKRLRQYITDFPNEKLINTDNVLCLPHLGASTVEAEENCAEMAVLTLKNYLEEGHITNSVNFPSVSMPCVNGQRIAIVNRNVPNMLGQISQAIASSQLNIIDMINRSRDEIAYTLVDLEPQVTTELLATLQTIDGVISCRVI